MKTETHNDNNKVEKKFIGRTADNIHVYIIENNQHMLAHTDVSEELLTEAIQKVTFGLENNERIITVDMGRIIGKQACVETTADDKVVEAKRPGRKNASRIVCNRDPVPTSKLTLGFSIKREDGLLTVYTAYPGERAPMELTDYKYKRLSPEEQAKIRMFWDTHALCSISTYGIHEPPAEAIVKPKTIDSNEEIRQEQ